MSNETLKDFNRLGVNFRQSMIREALPEHFTDDYPNLVSFLEGYYDQLDSDGQFGGIINELRTIRDIEDTTLERLDLLFDEIALNVTQSTFTFPRETIRNFGNFFRIKGSIYSAEGFFRAFFNEEVEIIYPKSDMFFVGESEIGPEQNKLLTNGGLYQVFSVLIKSPLSLTQWEELYRRFVHPTGFFLGAQVVLEASPLVTISTAVSDPDPLKDTEPVYGVATQAYGLSQGEISDLAALRIQANLPGGIDTDCVRTHVYRYLNDLDSTGTITMQYISDYYQNLCNWAGYSLTMDDSGYMSWDNTVETFDARRHEGNLFIGGGPYVTGGYVQTGYFL